jgi:shikimate kinase
MIRLVGPGGAGKSTTGALLAERLGVPFVDLDDRFKATVGDISRFIDTNGYEAYAARNVGVYADALLGAANQDGVFALSSGFMTYREDIDPDYTRHWRDIATAPSTFVLLPSLEFEGCVAEVVRRQRRRPFSRSVEREEQVIRARFALHRDIPAKKVETMRPVAEVVDELLVAVAAQQGAAPATSSRTERISDFMIAPRGCCPEHTSQRQRHRNWARGISTV